MARRSFPISVVHAVRDPAARPRVVVDAVQSAVRQLDVVILAVIRIGGPPFATQPPWSAEVDDAAAESAAAHVLETAGAFEDVEVRGRPERAERDARGERWHRHG